MKNLKQNNLKKKIIKKKEKRCMNTSKATGAIRQPPYGGTVGGDAIMSHTDNIIEPFIFIHYFLQNVKRERIK